MEQKHSDKLIKKNQVLLNDKNEGIKSLLDLLDIMGESTRFRIIYLLKINKNLYINDLSEIIGISQSGISHQVKVLERAGLLNKIREGQKMSCSLVPSQLISLLLENLVAIKKTALKNRAK